MSGVAIGVTMRRVASGETLLDLVA